MTVPNVVKYLVTSMYPEVKILNNCNHANQNVTLMMRNEE